jgi:hypothetical protein
LKTFRQWCIREKKGFENNESASEFLKKPVDETEAQFVEEFSKDSIPRQLQLLFSRLQLRDQRSVKTKDLTNSFGWKEADSFTQHDVQVRQSTVLIH